MRSVLLAGLVALLQRGGPCQAQNGIDRVNAEVATRDYVRTGHARVVREGSYTMYPYGHVQPTLRCAPLRVCTIELQGGEVVLDDVAPDRERWEIDFMKGPNQTPIIVAKPIGPPSGCDLTTNLVVTTDRRIYHFTLDSPPCAGQEASLNPDLPYTRTIKFYYPDEMVRRHASQAATTSTGTGAGTLPTTAPGEETSVESGLGMDISDLGALRFDYRWRADVGFPWLPGQVFDNGRRTCIRIPDAAARSALPVLFELDAAGSMSVINYVVRDGCYLADRVMERMVLVVGGERDGAPVRLLVTRGRERRAR